MAIAKVLGIAILVILVLGFAYIGLLYSTRGTPLTSVRAVGSNDGPPPVSDPEFLRTLELLTSVHLSEGNNIEVFINGDQTYPRLWADLRSARRSITLQLYFMNPGRMADTLQEILVDRARAGVHILFLYDAFGAQNMPQPFFDTLRGAGVRVAGFRPVHWYSIHKAQSRSHIRVVVVDGHIGYTGGFGIDDKWFGDGRSEGHWRDTNVRFEGPAVMQLQATFAAGWVEATGTLITGKHFFAPEGFTPDGTQLAALMHTSPTIGSTPAERFLALSIASARSRLYISNSYFVPDDDFRRLLEDAAKRGVDVRILTTSDETDVIWTWRAGRARYEELLKAGVRIYEYQPVMMHAKTLVVDGRWATVGTMNFDNRSMVFNDESNLVALDTAFGRQLEEIFTADLPYSKEIKLEEFKQRPFTDHLKEDIAALFGRLL
jgi:cardiolipin synthase